MSYESWVAEGDDERAAERARRFHQSPELMRLRYEHRYLAISRQSRVYAAAFEAGVKAGRWGRWYTKCPMKREGGALWYEWQNGWRKGRMEYEELKPKPKPPAGPNGGRRLRSVG